MSTNWDDLRYFIALAEQGTLIKAAELLGVSHSTVQRRVKAFETSLDTQLFEHSLQGYRLTHAGATLLQDSQPLKQDMAALFENIEGENHKFDGEVSITTTDTLAHYVMPSIVKELHTLFPQLQISLQVNNHLSNMHNREADIAVRTCLQPPEDLVGRQVGTVTFAVVTSPDYARQHKLHCFPCENPDLHYILLDDSFEETPFYRWFNDRLPNNASITVVSNFLCAAELAKIGLGITVLPSYIAARSAELQTLITENVIPDNALWILSHPDQRNTDRIKSVKNQLRADLSSLFSPEKH